MKIRIKGNSIRYRLSKSEVDLFLKTGYLEESVDFGVQKLIYSLKKHNETVIRANFNENKITILMPEKLAVAWEPADKVGFSGIDNKLSILIEKDFQCLDNTLEDQTDNFPNPALVC